MNDGYMRRASLPPESSALKRNYLYIVMTALRGKIKGMGLNFGRKPGFCMTKCYTAGQIKETLHYFLPEDETEVLIRRPLNTIHILVALSFYNTSVPNSMQWADFQFLTIYWL
jgi:hypothetical protein